MTISTDGRIHLIRCDWCGETDGGPSRTADIFCDRMRHLGWVFYEADDGWDSVCPDCVKKKEKEKAPVEILIGK